MRQGDAPCERLLGWSPRASWILRIVHRDDDEALPVVVGLENDFPVDAAVGCMCDEAPRYAAASARGAVMEHPAQRDRVGAALLHALLDVARELEFPIPPVRALPERGHS